MNLNAWLEVARQQKFAIGHFNVSDLGGMKAIVNAANSLKSPVIIGASQGESDFFGVRQFVVAARSLREDTGLPIFINADHTKTLEGIRRVVDAGFDSVHFDGSELPYSENISQTKLAVEYAKNKNPDISVEGELGYLRGSSKLQEQVKINQEDLTDPSRVAEFVKETGVDRLAPVFGNIHGIVTKQEERLDISLLQTIANGTRAFLVLHGGSGVTEDDVKAAIATGVVKVHINTELRLAYRRGLEEALQQMPNETTPYKYLPGAITAMQKVAEEKIKLFGSAHKAK